MLNKNANCYNIEKNFKYSTVICTFSEHITISEHFQLIFDNSNVNNDKQIKQKKPKNFCCNFSELSNFSFSSFWGKTLWNQKLLLLTAIARCSYYTLVCTLVVYQRWVVFHFFTNFFRTNFRHQNKNNVYQLSKKCCVYAYNCLNT